MPVLAVFLSGCLLSFLEVYLGKASDTITFKFLRHVVRAILSL